MARQAGMTLIELTVVLLVLVGLAGLLIPYVSGFVTKTHDSTGSSNIQSLNNAMQRYAVEHYDNYPNKMDSLLVDGNTVFPKMMGEMMPMGGSGSYFTPLLLDSVKAKALTNVGITTVMVMADTGDATFANTDTTTPTKAIKTGNYVTEITGAPLADLGHRLGKPVNTHIYHYVAFGIGDDATIAGQTVSDVPVHFSRNGDMGANNAYNHFVGVFEILKIATCEAQNWSSLISEGALATVSTGVTITYPTSTQVAPTQAELDAADTEAACVALNGVASALAPGVATVGTSAEITASNTSTADDFYVTSGVNWLNPSNDTAKFVGSVMAMGMGNLEGLGGAMTRYYENSASN